MTDSCQDKNALEMASGGLEPCGIPDYETLTQKIAFAIKEIQNSESDEGRKWWFNETQRLREIRSRLG